ncbi:MAG: hypothetical protein VKL39_12655 [Leptolyngbyaceae bacterium]|nr:hypothetical protein [Leptolyngbyaceae bacterium]
MTETGMAEAGTTENLGTRPNDDFVSVVFTDIFTEPAQPQRLIEIKLSTHSMNGYSAESKDKGNSIGRVVALIGSIVLPVWLLGKLAIYRATLTS